MTIPKLPVIGVIALDFYGHNYSVSRVAAYVDGMNRYTRIRHGYRSKYDFCDRCGDVWPKSALKLDSDAVTTCPLHKWNEQPEPTCCPCKGYEPINDSCHVCECRCHND